MAEDSRLINLENRVSKIEEDISELEKSVGILGAYLERSNEIHEGSVAIQKELSEAIVSMRIAMTEMRSEIVAGTAKTAEIEGNLSQRLSGLENNVGKAIDEVKTQINELEDRGKIDILSLIKERGVPALFGGGILVAIWQGIEKIIGIIAEVGNK